MNWDWTGLREAHPRAFRLLVFLKRARTKVGFILLAYCLLEGLWEWEVPFDPTHPNAWVLLGLALTLGGVVIRLAALGTIRKKASLTTSGIYSICRHPLYLGSMLITYGLCFVFNDPANFAFATAYFAVFYTITIAWEEARLGEQYGADHVAYCRRTPLLLPLGRLRRGDFSMHDALVRGGLGLIGVTTALLVVADRLAEFMRDR